MMCTLATQNGARTERIPTVLFRPRSGAQFRWELRCARYSSMYTAGPMGYLIDVVEPMQVHGAGAWGPDSDT